MSERTQITTRSIRRRYEEGQFVHFETKTDYDWALAEIAPYFDRPPTLGTSDADRFDLLATVIEAYEAKHWPIEPADPIDAIRYRMETAGYTQADLARLLGSRPRASEIMSRKRALTIPMAYKLAS